MISYSVYKVMHLTGVLMVFFAVGASLMHFINQGTKIHPWKKFLAITHGIGILVSLVGGFGLLARLGLVQGLPTWAIVKLVIWTYFAVITAIIPRKPALAKPLWLLSLVLGSCTAYLAIFKPF